MTLRARIATRRELEAPSSRAAAAVMGVPFELSRKLWEWVTIYEEFRNLGLFRPEILGFGCGKEPLPAAFARLGARVLATDQPAAGAHQWLKTDQYGGAERYGGPNLSFREVDMRQIPAEFEGKFDFLWSACALEHLGGLKMGARFVVDAMRCLKPGGYALHTTELNVSDPFSTIDEPDLALYRRADLERLFEELVALGHVVAPVDWTRKPEPPGPENRPHLAFVVGSYVTTSFFFAVQKCHT